MGVRKDLKSRKVIAEHAIFHTYTHELPLIMVVLLPPRLPALPAAAFLRKYISCIRTQWITVSGTSDGHQPFFLESFALITRVVGAWVTHPNRVWHTIDRGGVKFQLT